VNNISLLKKIRLGLKYKKTAVNLVAGKIRGEKTASFPRFISFYITNHCNLNCRDCINAAYRNKNIDRADISLKTFKKLVPELKKYKPLVYFTGGEPLLDKDIFKIIKTLSKEKILTSLTTNGFIVKGHVDQIIDSGLEFISLSLDDYREKIHDQLRGKKGSFKKLIQGTKQLIDKRRSTPSNIKINTVIRKENYQHLSKIYDFVEKLGVDEWSLQHFSFTTIKARRAINEFEKNANWDVFSRGKEINKDHYLKNKETEQLGRELAKIKARKYNTRFSMFPPVNDLQAYYAGDFPCQLSWCKGPFDSLMIFNQSEVHLCMGYKIGDLMKEHPSLLKIWQSKKAKEFRTRIAKAKVLAPCFRCCGLNFVFK
jgi:MoaA/NifB/PqqE/SkfB family radical SAM enzyme